MKRFVPVLLINVTLSAATLKPESLAAWNRYFAAAQANVAKQAQPGATFLRVDGSNSLRQRVRDGEVVVTEANTESSKNVPGALIHDWTGDAFLPGARIEDVIAVVRNYGHYREYYSPTIIRSRTEARNTLEDRYAVVMMNQSLVLRTALETDCKADFTQVSDKRWYSVSETTQIHEIADFGEADEHRLPVDQGSGYIWRLASITRFEERDGGVYIEVEALALSRDIPASLRFIVIPIVHRLCRNALTESLRQTSHAVHEVMASNFSASGASR